MKLETIDELRLKVPKRMNIPWLTLEYIKKNGFVVEIDEVLERYPQDSRFVDTSFGSLPIKSRKEYRAGDIIIFNEFSEETNKDGKFDSDRFYRLTQEEIEQYKREKRDLLPVGVVVHAP